MVCSIEKTLNKGSIEDKAEFYHHYNSGAFGSRPRTWKKFKDIVKSGWKDKVCIRSTKGVERSKTQYNLTIKEAKNYLNEQEKKGISRKNFTFNQSMPDEYLLIQGEVMRSTNFYDLTYTRIKKPMNSAFKEQTLYATGLEAISLLQKNMDPESYNNLQELFNCFPDSVIEFSCYGKGVGDKGWNTIFWEVRDY